LLSSFLPTDQLLSFFTVPYGGGEWGARPPPYSTPPPPEGGRRAGGKEGRG